MEVRLPGAAANHLHPGVNAEVAFTTLRDWAVAAGEKRMMGERVAETAKYTRPGQYRKLSLGPAALVEAGGMAQRGRREALRECMMAGVTEPPWRSRFYLASRKVRNKSIASFQASKGMSALPPIADVSLWRSEPPLRANTGSQARRFASLRMIRRKSGPINTTRLIVCALARSFTNAAPATRPE